MRKKKTKNANTHEALKTAHEASEKLAQPAAPIGLGAQISLIANAHSKISGKRNWLTTHSIDITIFIGLLWSMGKIINYYYPDGSWAIAIKMLDAFSPAAIVLLAIIYRLYPYINVFLNSREK